MQIGIIGSGRMAKAMGGYLQDCGYTVCGLWSRNQEEAGLAARYLGVPSCGALEDLILGSDLLLLAVSDDGISAVAEAAAECGCSLRGKWVGHLSGSRSLDVLAAVEERGGHIFSLHPLQTVPEPESGRRNLAGAAFMLEADESLRATLEKWLTPCGNQVAWISPGKKALYHLGACLASNYVMVLYGLAERALASSGIPEDMTLRALLPLMEATLHNYEAIGPVRGLTGPVSRGDVGTVRKHLESLPGSVLEHNEPLIRELGLEALAMAITKGSIGEKDAKNMESILQGGKEKCEKE